MRDIAFPIALRGYEREAVDAYVKRVNRLIGELETNRSPDAAVRRALEQVGKDTAGILQCAQETASDITARSHASADDCVREAERAANEIIADAEDRVHELAADYGQIWAERDRLLEEVRDLAERLLATADDAAEHIPTAGEDEAVAATRAAAWLPALEPRGSSEAGPVIGSEAPAAERSVLDESEPVAVEPTIGQPPDEPTLAEVRPASARRRRSRSKVQGPSGHLVSTLGVADLTSVEGCLGSPRAIRPLPLPTRFGRPRRATAATPPA